MNLAVLELDVTISNECRGPVSMGLGGSAHTSYQHEVKVHS
jgi:hypothetical protein